MSPQQHVTPKTFYLNEQHELARAEKEPGGRIPQYADIDWRARGTRISKSLDKVESEIKNSRDPMRSTHCYLVAEPVKQLSKFSADKSKAVGGRVKEDTKFSEKHSRVFKRLGMDLLGVTEAGSALVHMKPETVTQLSNSAQALPDLGAREKARWATIDRFQIVPLEAKLDVNWLRSMKQDSLDDVVIELQPLLTRSETDSLMRAILASFHSDRGERPIGTGTDYSGRQWLRSRLAPKTLEAIAKDFFSVQSLHSPLISTTSRRIRGAATKFPMTDSPVDVSKLPAIGVLDTGVPTDHPILGRYRRGGYVAPTSPPSAADPHGTFVSSRIVFGDLDFSAGPPAATPVGQARYYDVNVGGLNPSEIDGKSVLPALQAVVGTAPDIRVFNLSFDCPALDTVDAVKRTEFLLLVQDLDNFIFQNDVIAVIAAGNSPRGIVPSKPYPNHFDDPSWALGAWARSFNSLTCGSYVAHLSQGGVASQIGWPSPFCRIGPGLSASLKPDFSANGGNSSARYQYAPGLGVWGLSPAGFWEDQCGTSFAAPLLSQNAHSRLNSCRRFVREEHSRLRSR